MNGNFRKIYRHPYTRICLLAAALVCLGLVSYVAPYFGMTSSERAAYDARRAAIAADEAAANQNAYDREKELCHLTTDCPKFAVARRDCGASGNCIKSKMGDDDDALIGGCDNDGNIQSPPQDMPSGLKCFIRNHIR